MAKSRAAPLQRYYGEVHIVTAQVGVVRQLARCYWAVRRAIGTVVCVTLCLNVEGSTQACCLQTTLSLCDMVA